MPRADRVRIDDDGDTLVLTIPAKRRPWLVRLLILWLIAWVAGLFYTLFGVFTGSHDMGGPLYVIAWLAGWTLATVFAAVIIHWTLRGVEVITFAPDAITLVWHSPIWPRRIRCDMKDASALLVMDESNTVFHGKLPTRAWRERSAGTISFMLRGEMYGFGDTLDPEEATRVAKRIEARFPHLAARA